MNSCDVLVEHFAVANSYLSPAIAPEGFYTERNPESMYDANANLFCGVDMKAETGIQDYEPFTRGQSAYIDNKLQSFENTFGWIKNVAGTDLDMSDGFFSYREAGHVRPHSVEDPQRCSPVVECHQRSASAGCVDLDNCIMSAKTEQRNGSPDSFEMENQYDSGVENITEEAMGGSPNLFGSPESHQNIFENGQQNMSFGAVNFHQNFRHQTRARHHSEPDVFKVCEQDSPRKKAVSRSHSEALLALPVFKQESLDSGFQYVLAAATSPACKMNEETVTYLNQGQPYELKLKKYGDFSEIKGRTLKSIVRVVFHDRRLQYMEREQLDLWKQTRPGERILDIDIPLSYAVQNVKVEPTRLNAIEFTWDPAKDTGVFIKVNSISTEFTAKKHGGEKGVPFRIQVESYAPDDGDFRLVHCSSCQIKVFKPKGADRKHKTDREKMEKRSDAEKEKYQPSYECTVLAEITLEQALQYLDNLKQQSLNMEPTEGIFSRTKDHPLQQAAAARSANSTPKHQRAGSDISDSSDNMMSPKPLTSSPPLVRNFQYVGDSSNSESRTSLPPNSSWGTFKAEKEPKVAAWVPKMEIKPPAVVAAAAEKPSLCPAATAVQVSNWLKNNRFAGYVSTFSSFSGADLLRLSRDDLIQICGLADGIRLDNALQSKTVRPKLTIYVCQGRPGGPPNQLSTASSVGTNGRGTGVPLQPSVLPVSQTSSVLVADPWYSARSGSSSSSPSSYENDAGPPFMRSFNGANAPNQNHLMRHQFFSQNGAHINVDPSLNNNNQNIITNGALQTPEVITSNLKNGRKVIRKKKSPKYGPKNTDCNPVDFKGAMPFQPNTDHVAPAGPDAFEINKNGIAGQFNHQYFWNQNINGDAAMFDRNGVPMFGVKNGMQDHDMPNGYPGCDGHNSGNINEQQWPKSQSIWMPNWEESQHSLLSFLFAGEEGWGDQNNRGVIGSSTTERGCFITPGTKKTDSSPNSGSTEGVHNGSGSNSSHRTVLTPGGPSRQLSPSGPSPNSRFTMHRQQDTSPVPGSSPTQTSSSTGVGPVCSPVANATPLKYKRQLVEDIDSEDQDDEKVVTSTKKQRTRPLELSRKEVYHAIFLEQVTIHDLIEKYAGLFSVATRQIVEIYLVGPNNIDILVTDSVIQNFKDQARFALEATLVDNTHDQYKLHMQPMD